MKEKNPNGPIFIPKASGLGWTINFKHPVGFVILGGIVAVVALVELCVTHVIKL